MSQAKPNVLLLTRNFPPLQGGMERLNHHIYIELCEEYDVTVVGPAGAGQFCREGDQVYTSPALPLWRFLLGSAWQTLRACRSRKKPKLIVAGSGIAALPAFIAGKLTKIPVMTYLHGLDIVAPHPIYQWIFLPAIRQSRVLLVNSRNTRQLAIDAGIPEQKIRLLHPGTCLPNLEGLHGGRVFRESICAGNRPILLSVGRLTARKGLVEFIEHCMPQICRLIPDVLLVIIGGDPSFSVDKALKHSKSLIQQRISDLGLERNIMMLGNISDDLLTQAYAASQLHVFPVRETPGDVEGFGMVALEAAAHGLPTIAFGVGGVPDAIVDDVSGKVVPAGNYVEFTNAVTDALLNARLFTGCKNTAIPFAWTEFGKKLRSIVGS